MRKLLSRILPLKSEDPDSGSEPATDWSGQAGPDEPRPQAAIYRMPPLEAKVIRLYEDPSLYEGQEITAESDRVIAYLLATGALGRGPLQRARRVWASIGKEESLWRVVLRSGEVPEETVLEAAALSYGFMPVQVSLLETVGLIDHLSAQWPKSVLPRLIGMGILPVHPVLATRRARAMTFAASDPTRPQVRRMVETVATGPHTIGYLSPSGMDACVKAVSDFLPDLLPATIRSLRPQAAPEAPTALVQVKPADTMISKAA